MGGWTSLYLRLTSVAPSLLNGATSAYFRIAKWRSVGYRGTHSAQATTTMADIQIRILPALSDNYMYLLIDRNTKEAAIVDPVEPETVLAAVAEEGVNLTTLLTTHHHWDHAGGNKELLKTMPELRVIGGDLRIDGVTSASVHGSVLNVGGLDVTCLATPCHTTGHLCYYVTSKQGDKVVFTGDTLFLGGCGRFFEGTAPEMHEALNNVLSNLPGETKVYCGHEYSLQNLAFGAHVEPGNKDVAAKIAWCKEEREASPPRPTVPSTIEEEKKINPFMRVDIASVQQHAKETELVLTMASLRKEKDDFKAPK